MVKEITLNSNNLQSSNNSYNNSNIIIIITTSIFDYNYYINMNHLGWNMLPAEVSLLRINILSSVQQCFSILLKQWSFGEEGSSEQKKYNMLYLLWVFKH